jgi:hypothetical protein
MCFVYSLVCLLSKYQFKLMLLLKVIPQVLMPIRVIKLIGIVQEV